MLHQGECLDVLKTLEENSIDSLITDPPAGISFMNKDWDSGNNFIPAMTKIFKEALRVLKPGAHGLVWALPRTSHWTATALEQAGFEIRDVVTHLFGSGFPKSHNLGNGWGTALKPASEHWILIRKPCSEKTVAQNVLKHGTGGINIDACRVGTWSEFDKSNMAVSSRGQPGMFGLKGNEGNPLSITQGRFPANLVLDEEAAAMLDEQSGVLEQGGAQRGSKIKTRNSFYPGDNNGGVNKGKAFIMELPGGASRFFYVAKASKKDRNEGLEYMPLVEKKTLNDYTSPSEGRTADKNGSPQQNFHPTVKSTKLMEYLINLITPPNGVVLDPFMGSGSTGKAAKRLGFEFIGIEKDEGYFAIAERRIQNDVRL